MSRRDSFPVKDLKRRKKQTVLTIFTLCFCVSATLFLLLFSDRLGFGLTSNVGTLTLGLIAVFKQFTVFIEVLIFAVGAVLTSFISYLMMHQRTRDLGLIKAAGCPSELMAGYFTTELLIVTAIGCIAGVLLGVVLDIAVATIIFQSLARMPNYWFLPLVFVVFFGFSMIFGLRPILKAAKMPPLNAFSTVNYYGTDIEKKHRALKKGRLSWRLSTRGLMRRFSSTTRVVLFMSIVFMLVTITVAGGLIAKDTTSSWISGTISSNTLIIAHNSLGEQYQLLLSKFSGSQETSNFNYSNTSLAISNNVLQQLQAIASINKIQTQLVLEEHVKEVANFTIDPDTLITYPVGDSREGDIIIIGVDPTNVLGSWNLDGRFLNSGSLNEVVIGDSISNTMYIADTVKTAHSNPLLEGMSFENATFSIVGVAVDPFNNGNVAYVPISTLSNITGLSANVMLVTLNYSADRQTAITQIRSILQQIDPDLNVFELTNTVNANLDLLNSTWTTIMLLPILTLISAAVCLVGYMNLSIDEQRQEFAILRSVGAKPKTITKIVTLQSLILMLSSFGIGISFGVALTILILIKNPVITSYTVPTVAVWLLTVLGIMLLCCIYPAHTLSKKPILQIIS
jgi:ABC-type antimicrobial peptide transport system permease subunit